MFAVEIIFSSLNAAYETMQQIGYWQLEVAIISQTDGFMKQWWMCNVGTMFWSKFWQQSCVFLMLIP